MNLKDSIDMEIIKNYAEEQVIESYTITGVTRSDMYKMTQVYYKVLSILGNHLNKSVKKKEYLSDNDLYDIVAILDVFTKDNRICIKKSTFEKRKEELLEMHKKLSGITVLTPVEQPEPQCV